MVAKWPDRREAQQSRIRGTYRCANLDMELANRVSVVHGVESRNLVHAHGRHLQEPRDLVHDADARVSILSLAQVKDGHDSSLSILGWIAFHDLLDHFLVLRGEFEGDAGIVLGAVSVLQKGIVLAIDHHRELNRPKISPEAGILTTASVSLRAGVLEVNERHCRVDRRGRAWRLCRRANGTSLEAILEDIMTESGGDRAAVSQYGALCFAIEDDALLSLFWCFAITKRRSSWSAALANRGVGINTLGHHQFVFTSTPPSQQQQHQLQSQLEGDSNETSFPSTTTHGSRRRNPDRCTRPRFTLLLAMRSQDSRLNTDDCNIPYSIYHLSILGL